MAIKFERLEDHDRNKFSCEEEELNKYIKEKANQDQRNGFAKVYIAVDDQHPKEIVGFYTFCPFSIPRIDLPEEYLKKLPKYPDIPGYLIGRLARDQRFRGQGIGELLLIDALRKIIEFSEIASGNAVFVEAKDDKARKFYEKYGFLPLPNPNKGNFLFLPLKTLKKNSSFKEEHKTPSAIWIIKEWFKGLFFLTLALLHQLLNKRRKRLPLLLCLFHQFLMQFLRNKYFHSYHSSFP